jgi:hypothetical protein
MNPMDEVKIARYDKYKEACKKAAKKFRANNKEKIAEYSLDYYHARKDDPEFIEKLRKQARDRYANKSEEDKELIRAKAKEKYWINKMKKLEKQEENI